MRSLLAQRDDVTLLDGRHLELHLAGAIADAERLIVIDAAQLDAAPGTSHVFEGDQMDAFIGGNRRMSVHEVSLIDLLSIAPLEPDHLPQQRALIGISRARRDRFGRSRPPRRWRRRLPQVCRPSIATDRGPGTHELGGISAINTPAAADTFVASGAT